MHVFPIEGNKYIISILNIKDNLGNHYDIFNVVSFCQSEIICLLAQNIILNQIKHMYTVFSITFFKNFTHKHPTKTNTF